MRTTFQHLLPLLLLLWTASPATARYIPPTLFNMLWASDLVASGTISEVREHTFVLTLDHVMAGTETRPSVVLPRFQNWACSSRWQPYAVGQKVLIFANAVEADSHDYELRSPGAEGEHPIVNGRVLVHGYGLSDGQPQALGILPAYPVAVETFAHAVRKLRRCFGSETRADHRVPTRTCPLDELVAFSEGSPFHHHLVQGALR